MSRYTILLVLIHGLLLPLTGQDTETRSLESFNKIKVATGIEATIIEGSSNEIKISAEGVELDDIKSSINGGELVVKLKTNFNLWKEGKMDVEVIISYTQELEGIYVNSGASIYSDGPVSSENLEISSSSGASLDLDVRCGDIEASVSSGAEIDIKGEASRLDLRFNTGASFRGFDLETQKARVKGGTGGDAKINVTEYIKTNVNTGASLDYKGNPSKKDINKGTGGEVRHRDFGS